MSENAWRYILRHTRRTRGAGRARMAHAMFNAECLSRDKRLTPMRILLTVVQSMVVFSVLLVYSLEAQAEKNIGIFLFSDETRYTLAAKGIIDKLIEGGFGPSTKFIVENAEYNKATAAEYVKKFVANKMDLIFTIGTSATMPIAREIKNTPIVFAIVYDPVAAGIAKSWTNSGNNTTGATTNMPMSKIFDSLKLITSVKKLAVLYTPDEKNSEITLKNLQDVHQKYKINVIPIPFTTKEEIAQILPEVIRTSDALYITGSNLVDSQVLMIVEMATKAKVVTITHLEDLVAKGVLLGVCSDPYLIGRQAGEQGIQILNGAKPSSIPIEIPKESKVILNMKTLRAGHFQMPQDLMKTVRKKIE
jgi:putative tryptophan/tyrosine transport system substrate-binding protein